MRYRKAPIMTQDLPLRFARVERIQDDKTAEEIDTLSTLKKLYNAQFRFKGRGRELALFSLKN